MSTVENRAAVEKVRDALSTEHQSIRGLVEQLRQPRSSPHEAFPLLDELHHGLAAHFAHEEYPGGFYDTLGACTTEHGDDLRALVDQHFLILSAAQSLKERARAEDAPLEPFAADLAALVDRIVAHERREHEFVALFAR